MRLRCRDGARWAIVPTESAETLAEVAMLMNIAFSDRPKDYLIVPEGKDPND